MALFSNIFKKVTSTFAFQGRTWSQTWDRIKELPWKTSPIDAYRSYKESTIHYRNKPFLEGLDERLLPPAFAITPTRSRLRNKYQYLFKVRFKYKNIGYGAPQTMSMLSGAKITKGASIDRMFQDLLLHKNRQKYLDIEDIDVELIGVNQSKWL